ncbi:galactosylceramide sulfotransferase [Lingula anatina]|uniref:Galactosylceramide sulfotransferase n=1 Tax=Lingula anatina TaxID=7574 RepID=A0A1S3KDE6_LINAN|nr:galactosylceramide sulfotransferase [Lingula anatina]|eukprot:XP_013420281.1 galactosylceramide sulfotransferase [Lingula anatina]
MEATQAFSLRHRDLIFIFIGIILIGFICFYEWDGEVTGCTVIHNAVLSDDRISQANLDEFQVMSRILESDSDLSSLIPLLSLKFNNGTQSDDKKQCKPKTKIVSIKIHKTGSTTLSAVVLRYAYRNRLRVAISSSDSKSGILRDQHDRLPLKANEVWATHGRYRPEILRQFTTEETFFVTTVREPFERFKSHFNFFHMGNVLRQNGDSTLRDYFTKPMYSKSRDLMSNYMLKYLGFPNNKTLLSDSNYVSDYIRKLDAEFHLLIPLEYFDQGLILTRRMLCWDISDIIYLKLRPQTSDTYSSLLQDNDPLVTQLFQEANSADYMLYNHFKSKFENIMNDQDGDFYDELSYFKNLLFQVGQYCQYNKNDTSLRVAPSKWSPAFTLNRLHCKYMEIYTTHFKVLFKMEYYKRVFAKYFESLLS